MERLLQDIQQALRLMVRHPGFTGAALVTLGLGIGANTAIFSIVYGVLVRPLPYHDTDRLIRLWEEHPGGNAPVRAPLFSNRTYHAWNEDPKAVERLAAFSRSSYTLTGSGEPTRVTGVSVTPGLFHLPGAAPAAGRFFTDENEGRHVSLARARRAAEDLAEPLME